MNLEFNCPHCNRLLAIDERWRNTEVECPDCGNSLIPEEALRKMAREVERKEANSIDSGMEQSKDAEQKQKEKGSNAQLGKDQLEESVEQEMKVSSPETKAASSEILRSGDVREKTKNDFKTFMRGLCRYYMEFLETDFKARRNPSRKVVYRKKDLLTAVPLFKYDKLKKAVVRSIDENFKNKGLTNITKGKYTIKLSDDAIERINDAIDHIDYDNFQVAEIIQAVGDLLGKDFADREEFLEELAFEIESLVDEHEGVIAKGQVMGLLSDCVCYDFYDELYELWKNKTILEGEELYLYFYDIAFKGNRYPVFFLPVTLVKRREKDRNETSEVFDIEFGGQVLINKFAIEFVSQAVNKLTESTRAPINIPKRHLYLGDVDIRSEMQKMLNEICSFFKVDHLNLNYVHMNLC